MTEAATDGLSQIGTADEPRIVYKLADNPGDYRRARTFLAENDFPEAYLSFPTVLALEGSDVVGILGTHQRKDMIVAGPLALKRDRPRFFTALRLTDAYENVMRLAGVQSYIFYTEDERFEETVKKALQIEPYAIEDGRRFFLRKL